MTALIVAATDMRDATSDGTTAIETGCRSPSAASAGKMRNGAGRGSSVDQAILSAESQA